MRLGVDLGGTKIEVVTLDDSGRERHRRRVPTPRNDYTATLAAIVGLVDEAERSAGRCRSVGVGIPGSISPHTGLVRNANSTWLNGRPLADDLERALQRVVRVANDANCFALSEATDGAAVGRRVVFGVILGTGVGGGIVVDGRLLEGANRIAGEWGHNPLPWPEPGEWPGDHCYCGRTGCIETFLSGPGLARDYKRTTGEPIEPKEIVRRAGEGEAAATACLDRYVNRLTRALASIINVLDPDAIVLGGGLSAITRLYADVPAQWEKYVFSDHVATELLPPKFGDSSGVRGAAWLWPSSV